MRREASAVRSDWKSIVEQNGLIFHEAVHPSHLKRKYWDESVHYVFTVDEVNRLKKDTEELHRICLAAVNYIVENQRFADFAIPEWAWPAITDSWRRADPYLFGRFDLRYAGDGPAKMFEYNGDTPAALVECALIQRQWQSEIFPHDGQWNHLNEAMVARWKHIASALSTKVHFGWTAGDRTGEDRMTVAYIREAAALAGIDVSSILLEDIGWVSEQQIFTDTKDREITALFKFYPWEWLLEAEFKHYIVNQLPRMPWIEPLWKMLLSNKALLAILWELYPDHPNLLPAYLNHPHELTSYVQKPLLGREGANTRVVTPDLNVVTPGEYGEEGYLYQEFKALPEFEGEHPVLGVWMVGEEAAALGIRETSGLITDDTSSFVSHRIALTDAERQQYLNRERIEISLAPRPLKQTTRAQRFSAKFNG